MKYQEFIEKFVDKETKDETTRDEFDLELSGLGKLNKYSEKEEDNHDLVNVEISLDEKEESEDGKEESEDEKEESEDGIEIIETPSSFLLITDLIRTASEIGERTVQDSIDAYGLALVSRPSNNLLLSQVRSLENKKINGDEDFLDRSEWTLILYLGDPSDENPHPFWDRIFDIVPSTDGESWHRIADVIDRYINKGEEEDLYIDFDPSLLPLPGDAEYEYPPEHPSDINDGSVYNAFIPTTPDPFDTI